MSSFSGEPRQTKSNTPPSSPPSFFTSLPKDLVLEILARVPRRYHPILSCVSKNFRDHVRSPEIQKKRSLLSLDSPYICFHDFHTRHWYRLRRIKNDPIEDILEAVEVPSPSVRKYSSIIAVDHEIFVCGTNLPSSNLSICDSRSGKLRRGPNMLVDRYYSAAVLVGEKIYVMGGQKDGEIEAESFDLKKQIWEVARNPEVKGCERWTRSANVSLDRKVYALCLMDSVMTCYNPRDGSCKHFELPNGGGWSRYGVCVMQNVLYVYFAKFGLMWFDTKLKVWKVVDGLSHLENFKSVAMAEYYGKLALLWDDDGSTESKEIWCRMIGLVRSEVGILGTAEPDQLLGTVPLSYHFLHCLSVSD